MLSIDVTFNFQDYRTCLRQFLDRGPRGTKLALARALRCQPGFVTQILKGEKQLSLEQALGFTSFAGLEGAEKEYFLLLVQKDRAGTRELRDFFQVKLGELRRERASLLKHRLKAPRAVKGRDLVD